MGTPPGGQPLIYLQIARMLEDDILRGVYREEELLAMVRKAFEEGE